MSKILFLGAGASKDAGYPLAKELLREIRNKQINYEPYKGYQAKFETYLSNAEGLLSDLFKAENPELIISIIDLLEMTLLDLTNVNAEENEFKSALDKYGAVIRAKDSYKCLIDDFFKEKAYFSDDHTKDYLYKMFAKLEKGDSVITTNWDLLSESILYEQNKWFPNDGYGFNVRFKQRSFRRGKAKILSSRSLFPTKSFVKVYKLHGSIGWHLNNQNIIYYCRDHFLTCLVQLGIVDINCPDSGSGPDQNPVMMYPSCLKQLDNKYLQEIWYRASKELNKAEKITFVGYSLPEADMAIRVLLNPLRYRLEKDKVEIDVVIGPHPHSHRENEVEKRWRKFLGDKIRVHKDSARDYFMCNCYL